MSGRWRSFLGGIAILVFLAAYVWLAVVIGDLVPDHWAARLVYFAVVGMAWGAPLIPVLSWIAKGHRGDGKM